MNRLGCAGLMVGAGLGFLLLAILVLLTRPVSVPVATQPPTIPPDATVVISDRMLSQLASNSLQRPTTIEFSPDGEMQVTAPFPFRDLEPVVTIGVALGMESTSVTSELRWLKLGFLYIPGKWLPQQMRAATAGLGPVIERQTPPDFALVGLQTLPNGLEIKLKWVGQ
jgi:hypothetical protein